MCQECTLKGSGLSSPSTCVPSQLCLFNIKADGFCGKEPSAPALVILHCWHIRDGEQEQDIIISAMLSTASHAFFPFFPFFFFSSLSFPPPNSSPPDHGKSFKSRRMQSIHLGHKCHYSLQLLKKSQEPGAQKRKLLNWSKRSLYDKI